MTAFFPPVAPQKGGQLSSGSRRLFRYPTTSNVLLLLSLFVISYSLLSCNSHKTTTLIVRNQAQECIAFEYALISLPHSLSDTLSQPVFCSAEAQTVALSLVEPTFIAVRTRQNPRTYLLLIAPNDRVELQLRPLGYEVLGSPQSARICELNEIFKGFNDSVQLLKRKYEWTYAPEVAAMLQEQMRHNYDSLVAHTRRTLTRFIAQEPLSKANLLALQARYNGDNYFFDSPRDRAFAREIASRIMRCYADTLLAAKVLRECADE